MAPRRTGQSKSSGLRRNLVETEILECAARLFSARSYSGTSLQDIADDLGTSRSSLYHYFSNKEEILLRLVGDLVLSSEAALKHMKAADRTDAVERLRTAVEALLGPIIEAPSRFRLLLTVEAELPAAIAQRWRDTRRKIVTEVTEIIRSGVEGGQLRAVDEQIATFSVLGMCNWVAWWPERQREDLEGLRKVIADIAVSGLALADGRPPVNTPEAALGELRGQLDRLETLISAPRRKR
jgi:AcrR family transcriptional regulator